MFIHLHVHSPFSLKDGASRIEALLERARADGAVAMALTDRDTVAGLAPFLRLAAEYGVRPISGTELTLARGGKIVLLAQNERGYENICRLLTLAYRGQRLQPRIRDEDLIDCAGGLIALTGGRFSDMAAHLLRRDERKARERLFWYRDLFEDRLYVAVSRTGLPGDRAHTQALMRLAKEARIPLVATNDVHYASQADFPAHDLLVCMREKITVNEAHPERPFNRENDLKSPEEMTALFSDCPECVANTWEIAKRCERVPRLGEPRFPEFRAPEDRVSGAAFLRELVYAGAKERYGQVDEALCARLDHELEIIAALGFVDYFLVVWDIAAYARQNRIRYAGRGSAADSAVAYCLYITDVDAVGRHLLFERFMSLERAEKPDIDIDFDSRRRDEVRDYVYRTYGSDHVAAVCTYSTFRGRSAVREIGKALGLPEALCDALAKRLPFMLHADRIEEALSKLPELRELELSPERLGLLFEMGEKLAGFPKFFGTHVGGLVISRKPLLQITSLQPSAKGILIVPFDKDAVEDLGLVKLDLLSLRTMSAIDDTLDQSQKAGDAIDYDRIPLDDPETFAMIARGETIGTFQLESPAQRALQNRLGASRLEDVVASVALIRPGPIKGNMVDPFLACRKGMREPSYLHPLLEPILSKTYGVVLFQEQVIEIATAVAQFTPGEADRLRRVMSHARSAGEMEKIGEEFVEKAVANGIDQEVADTIFSYMRSYASYGFCEAHAAAFATTAYKTAYLSRHRPAEFFSALIRSQPMGYYPLHVLVADVRRRGVRVYGIDVNRSDETAVGSGREIRLGFLQVSGIRERTAQAIVKARALGGIFDSLRDFCVRVTTADRLELETLIRVGAFDSLLDNRRTLLWHLPTAVRTAREDGSAEQSLLLSRDDPLFYVSDFSFAERVTQEYRWLGVGVTGHYLALYRDELRESGCVSVAEALSSPPGTAVTVAGIVIRPHRPPTKSGKTVVFFSLEDETGMIDVTVFQDVYQRDGAALFNPHRGVIIVRGPTQNRDGAWQLSARTVKGFEPTQNDRQIL